MQIIISAETFEFIQSSYRESVDNLLDDSNATDDLKDAVASLERIGNEIGLSFWAVVNEEDMASEFEIDRLKKALGL